MTYKFSGFYAYPETLLSIGILLRITMASHEIISNPNPMPNPTTRVLKPDIVDAFLKYGSIHPLKISMWNR